MSSGLIKEAQKLSRVASAVTKNLSVSTPIFDALVDGAPGQKYTWHLYGSGDSTFHGSSPRGHTIIVDTNPCRTITVRQQGKQLLSQFWIDTTYPQSVIDLHRPQNQTEESLRSDLRDLRLALRRLKP